MLKNADKYFRQHPTFNSLVHGLGGIGIGILITYPYIGLHPVRWGIFFLLLSALGHLFAAQSKRK